MNATNKKIIEDTLVDVKFSGIQWKLDEGFSILVMINRKEVILVI